jgi:hypothetical protein
MYVIFLFRVCVCLVYLSIGLLTFVCCIASDPKKECWNGNLCVSCWVLILIVPHKGDFNYSSKIQHEKAKEGPKIRQFN